MAGMLPGVECARRRRFHQGGGCTDSQSLAGHGRSRHSSFCLYTSNHETHLNSSSSSLHQRRNSLNQSFQCDKLGGVAREAKERLDERLRTQRKSETKRHTGEGITKCEDGVGVLRSVVVRDLQTEVFGSKKSSSKRFSWAKFGTKTLDIDECAVCLEGFKAGETLVHLPCSHRFHSRCLMPWLESSANCPCCRTGILS